MCSTKEEMYRPQGTDYRIADLYRATCSHGIQPWSGSNVFHPDLLGTAK